MDIFSLVADQDTLAPATERYAEVVRVCDFVKSLDDQQIKKLEFIHSGRDFDIWERNARSLYGFALEHGYEQEWSKTSAVVEKARKGIFWNRGWDYAHDYTSAELLKPWAGKAYSKDIYDYLTSPLRSLGFT